jgi:hypothetical protein
MKRAYETYSGNEITRELLDSIKRGNLVKCNGWGRPFRVHAASKNYFVMKQWIFGHEEYSVCEKLPASYTRNNFTAGSFRIGPDDWVCGSPCGYNWPTEAEALEYLNQLESGKTKLSERRGTVDLVTISIKREKTMAALAQKDGANDE